MNAMAYDQYRKVSVETVSSGKLLLMLYDGAIKNIDTAQKAIKDQDMNTAHQQLVNAQDILMELMCTLDMNYEVSHSLYSLYEYFYYQLVQANLKKDADILNEVRAFLTDLRNVWEEAAKKAGAKAKSGCAGSLSLKG